MKSKPRTVELVKSSYQPSKAELEDDSPLKFPAGMSVTERMEALSKAMLKPINPRWIDRPRSRR